MIGITLENNLDEKAVAGLFDLLDCANLRKSVIIKQEVNPTDQSILKTYTDRVDLIYLKSADDISEDLIYDLIDLRKAVVVDSCSEQFIQQAKELGFDSYYSVQRFLETPKILQDIKPSDINYISDTLTNRYLKDQHPVVCNLTDSLINRKITSEILANKSSSEIVSGLFSLTEIEQQEVNVFLSNLKTLEESGYTPRCFSPEIVCLPPELRVTALVNYRDSILNLVKNLSPEDRLKLPDNIQNFLTQLGYVSLGTILNNLDNNSSNKGAE